MIVVFPDHNHLLLVELQKVRKKAKIRNGYNQVPHLTRDTIWKTDKNTRKQHTLDGEDVSPFIADDHKAARNRHDSITKANTKHK